MTGVHVALAAEPKAAVHMVARNALGTGRTACRALSRDGAGAVLRRLRGSGDGRTCRPRARPLTQVDRSEGLLSPIRDKTRPACIARVRRSGEAVGALVGLRAIRKGRSEAAPHTPAHTRMVPGSIRLALSRLIVE
jgi:hypothetical protein